MGERASMRIVSLHSTKRVAAAVSEGAQVVAAIHDHLATLPKSETAALP
jgi:uncharacterized NAD-dependent epimerase/dehydratase family protein